jgi:hypothetical protein
MPEHDVRMSFPDKPLKNVDATIAVWSDGKKLGEMRISRGSLDWRSAYKKTAKSIAWERVAELLNAG